MAQDDYNIPNQSFPSFRSDLNSALSAINSSNSGTSRPSSAVAGTIWLDTSGGATANVLKFYDGSDDISLATINTTANTVDWIDSTVVSDLVNDTSPQLGGQLDVNGNSIGDGTRELLKFIETASAVNEVTLTNSATGNPPELSATGDDTNIDLKLTPKGSGKLNLDGIKFPNADGSANQVLTTDGSGVLSFADASGGGTSWQSAVKTANFTAVAGEGYFINTSGGAFEVDLPSSPSVGDEIEFVDFSRSFATNNLTLDQGSNKFQSNTSPKPVYNVNGQSIRIVYSGSTQGWIPTSDDDVALGTPQTKTVNFLVIAGGGAGGRAKAGGGGAGGYRASFNSEASGGGASSETALQLNPGTQYTITIGGGASAASGPGAGADGVASSITGSDITDITTVGGGGGGGDTSGQNGGRDGGSGGGQSGGGASGQPEGSGTANQGFDGGTGFAASAAAGGGGGGAGAAGEDITGNQQTGGDGGTGVASTITGSSVTRAGGGAGTNESGSYGGGTGGAGGGGNGSQGGNGGAGTTNTGSGGGGSQSGSGGAGGSGVVILRMATADYSGTTTGSPTVDQSTVSGQTILIYNGDGSYTA